MLVYSNIVINTKDSVCTEPVWCAQWLESATVEEGRTENDSLLFNSCHYFFKYLCCLYLISWILKQRTPGIWKYNHAVLLLIYCNGTVVSMYNTTIMSSWTLLSDLATHTHTHTHVALNILLLCKWCITLMI